MKKKIWIVKPPTEDRPCVTALDFGLYCVFPLEDAAVAFTKSGICAPNCEVVEGELKTI